MRPRRVLLGLVSHASELSRQYSATNGGHLAYDAGTVVNYWNDAFVTKRGSWEIFEEPWTSLIFVASFLWHSLALGQYVDVVAAPLPDAATRSVHRDLGQCLVALRHVLVAYLVEILNGLSLLLSMIPNALWPACIPTNPPYTPTKRTAR
ncbi:hypothetical protein DFH07DRAFT_962673 [Mycena maculata]|uniref:Uncharacterized protein n=1 Tax=Mycena maculata TaxID=230809 RepID=A0AAD7INN1_9AGAR|nr:hypothetical protein DFH07DRAFT_962673 [Mycena maculata]